MWKGTSAIWREFDGEILKLILRERGKFVFTFVVVERGFSFYECRKMFDSKVTIDGSDLVN